MLLTSFCAARACSTSCISLLFSRSLVAGVRWSSSRSGIFLKTERERDSVTVVILKHVTVDSSHTEVILCTCK